MIDKNLKIKDLSQITGYTRGHLSCVINGHIDSPKVKKIITLALNEQFDDLWKNQSNRDYQD